MISRVGKNGYDLSNANKEEISELLKTSNIKHVWANQKTLNKFKVPFWQYNNWFTVVNKLNDNIIYINHWY